MTAPRCKCGRYLSRDGRPCFCRPWWVRGLWAVSEWRVRRDRARRIDGRVRELFMGSGGAARAADFRAENDIWNFVCGNSNTGDE